MPRREPREAAGEVRPVFVEQVGGELVDRDDDEQLGRGGGERPAGGAAGAAAAEMNLRMSARVMPAKAGIQLASRDDIGSCSSQ